MMWVYNVKKMAEMLVSFLGLQKTKYTAYKTLVYKICKIYFY